MRTIISLACTDCKRRNYSTMKNKKNDPDRLELKKFCRFCRKRCENLANVCILPTMEILRFSEKMRYLGILD